VSFAIGQRVRISSRHHDGHHRTPDYAKGRAGTIARAHGTFTNPETRAYGDNGLPEQALYLVLLDGEPIYLDVFEHWLEEDR
jgi:nitrile hydratase